jgi:hypothetical protein
MSLNILKRNIGRGNQSQTYVKESRVFLSPKEKEKNDVRSRG